MSKTLRLAATAQLFINPVVVGQQRTLNDINTDLTVYDDGGYMDFEIAAGATASIGLPVFRANQEYVLVPTYVTSSDAGFGKFTVKVTHASGNSTFLFRSIGAFATLSTDTAVEVTNSDATNILLLRVSYYRQTT